jgi:hypothetical protein
MKIRVAGWDNIKPSRHAPSLFTVANIAIIAKSLQLLRRQPAAATLALILMILCAGIPIGSWTLWSKAHFGDAGSTTGIAFLTWTRKI